MTTHSLSQGKPPTSARCHESLSQLKPLEHNNHQLGCCQNRMKKWFFCQNRTEKHSEQSARRPRSTAGLMPESSVKSPGLSQPRYKQVPSIPRFAITLPCDRNAAQCEVLLQDGVVDVEVRLGVIWKPDATGP